MAFDTPIEMSAFIPNCTLFNLRPSGIYGNAPFSAEIVESLENNLVKAENDIRLLNGSETLFQFDATPASKRLSRDRDDWTLGRKFYDIDGLQIGGVNVSFTSVFIASGALLGEVLFELDDFEEDLVSEYSLIAEVDGECPPRPSGREDHDDCMVRISLLCQLFPEDSSIVGFHPIYSPRAETSLCQLNQFAISWVRNFEVDQQLAATVAGIYSMARINALEGNTRQFNENGILAALFALGVVEERPVIDEVIRPRVNLTFVIFIFLPLVVVVLLFLLGRWLRRFSMSDGVPTEAWELLIFGAENEDRLPKRDDNHSAFPEPDDTVVISTKSNGPGKPAVCCVLNSENDVLQQQSTDSDDELEEGDAATRNNAESPVAGEAEQVQLT